MMNHEITCSGCGKIIHGRNQKHAEKNMDIHNNSMYHKEVSKMLNRVRKNPIK